jgi:acyl-CoA synthetase (AMP-forming)/AMP-acid ligase II
MTTTRIPQIVLASGMAAVATKVDGVSSLVVVLANPPDTQYLDEQYFLVKDSKLLMGFTAFAVEMKLAELTNWTAADALEQAAAKWPNKEAIVFDNVVYTFAQWNNRANQVARWARSTANLKRGDVVAVMLENKPECLFIWTGFAKVGVVAALINNNLRQKPLMHCIKVCSAKALLYGAECGEAVHSIADDLALANLPLYVQGCASPESIDWIWDSVSASPVPKTERAGVGYNDACMYIFTSGTTGLPKAAIVKHAKVHGAGFAFALQFGIRHEDRIYNSGLPLYHSAANNVGGGVCLNTGATLVLRKKFSASAFWKEVAHFNCTVVQYIGELCRYLLATPPSPFDKRHNCRLAVGNGLRPDIWGEFQTRFNLKEIGEFYGATEGNVALFNLCKDPRARGAVGHMGVLFKQLGLCTLLRYDPQTGEIVRDKNGRCIECLPGEAGEAVGEMKGRAAGSFDGYLGDREQSEKKLLRDVFRKGDCYFRTGDLLMRDGLGYYYFMDRMGDTFRWKGENVATTEVAEAVSRAGGVAEVTVYGVQIPGKDGRACCAAVVPSGRAEDVDLAGLLALAKKDLPAYAVPMFVRLLPKLATTGTFKHQKGELRDEGMDVVGKVKDPMFFHDAHLGKYVPLSADVYREIVGGRARL